MLVCGFDVETTGLDVKEDAIIQIGLVLWDTEAPINKAKIKHDSLLHWKNDIAMDPEAQAVHGITREDLIRFGTNAEWALTRANEIMLMADVVCAHNGNLFDKPMYTANCQRAGVAPVESTWIDTCCDIEYPAHIQTRKLTHLAAEHNFVNPFPHDAISDVLTMLKIADLYDWNTALESAKAPTIMVRANVTFHQKELAKKQGFRWDGANKVWVKAVKQFQLEKVRSLATEAGFTVTELYTV